MRRKHNPLVSVAALVLLATILVLICAGCSAEAEAATTTDTKDRFTYEKPDAFQPIFIITDNETGVQYLYIKSGSGAGLTVLQPGED